MTRIARKFGLLLFSLCACSEAPPESGPAPPAGPFERVDRLELVGTGTRSMVEARGETRMAYRLDVGGRAELCVPEALAGVEGRTLSIGSRALGGSEAELLLRLGTQAPQRLALSGNWRDLDLGVPESRECLVLQVVGRPGTQVAISTPLLSRRGRRLPWVILYVVDTLRFDFTPFADDAASQPPLAPALEALARDGVVYRRVFSTSSWTRPTVATLLTGLGPSLHRVYDRQDRLPAAIERLPDWLAERGWFTEALSSNPNVLPLWGFMSGFDRFIDVGSEGWAARQSFEALTQRVVHRFEQDADRPLFLYVHDNEPHSPYRPAPSYRKLFGAPAPGSAAEIPIHRDDPQYMREMRSLYRASIRSMSDRLAEMVTGLKRVGRYEEALIVVVGDHGEEFGDHGDVLHGKTLYQEQLHVPLVIKAPASFGVRGEVDAPVSTASVFATMRHFLARSDDSQSPAAARLPLPGEEAAGRQIYSELSLDGERWATAVSWPWKYLRDGDGAERLFDLDADPAEEHDLAEEQPERLRSLAAGLDRWRSVARTGLALGCVAGAREETARFEVLVGGEGPPDTDVTGLELLDRVDPQPGGVVVAFALRPAEQPAMAVARFRASVAARAQPDRDLLRLPVVAGDSISIRALGDAPAVRLEGPDGELLALDRPIPLERLTVSVAPVLPEGRDSATCLVYFLELPGEVTPDADVDAALRERLRALGYLH